MYHRGSVTQKELNRLSRVSQNDIVSANSLKSQKELQHFFSPFTSRGQRDALRKSLRFEHSLENGWTQRQRNDRKPDIKGEYRMLINRNGVPYTAPSGPARGKLVLFDSWQSNEELMDIYENAFEKEWIPGTLVHGIPSYVDPHHSFDEEGGHITRIDYNEDMEVMRVHWANRDYVTCYLGVPVGVYDTLHNCKGKTVSGHGKHNHLLGITFWDIIRIRGTMHGGRYPFFYNGGAPSGKQLHDISKDPRSKHWNSVQHRASEDWRMMNFEQDIAKMNAIAGSDAKEQNHENAVAKTENIVDEIQAILNSKEFRDKLENDQDFNFNYIDFVKDFEEQTVDDMGEYSPTKALFFVTDDRNKETIKELRKMFGKGKRKDADLGSTLTEQEVNELSKYLDDVAHFHHAVNPKAKKSLWQKLQEEKRGATKEEIASIERLNAPISVSYKGIKNATDKEVDSIRPSAWNRYVNQANDADDLDASFFDVKPYDDEEL